MKSLHPYQNKAIEYIKSNPKCALFIDVGLGKTVISLSVIKHFLKAEKIKRVLIIAPLRVCNTVWRQECEKWNHLKDLDVSICTGSQKKRLSALKKDNDIQVINKDCLIWINEKIKSKELDWHWDMVVVDESSSFKSYKAKRFKCLRSFLDRLNSIVLLSSTPSPNGLLDLWSQIFLIDKGERLGKRIGIYRAKYFYKTGYLGYEYRLRKGMDKVIQEKIKDVCITMRAKDYLDLPDKISIIYDLEFPSHAKKQYKELEKTFVLQLEKAEISAVSAGVLVNKLLQAANGFVYDENKIAHAIHDVKIKAIQELIDENPNESFFVAYNFKYDLFRLKAALPMAKVLSVDGDELKDWNDRKIRVLLAHPASAGFGLNAQFGGSCVVWFGLNWSLELYQQFNARIHRQGQKNNVRVIHFVLKDSVDEKIMKALESKAKTQNQLLEYLKNSYI